MDRDRNPHSGRTGDDRPGRAADRRRQDLSSASTNSKDDERRRPGDYLPSGSLPKGGGTVRGITFAADPQVLTTTKTVVPKCYAIRRRSHGKRHRQS
jgi:hypothetical protein